jgi:hypothetical protein
MKRTDKEWHNAHENQHQVQKPACRKATVVHQHARLRLRHAVRTHLKNRERQKNLVGQSARVHLHVVEIVSTRVRVAIVRAQQKKV